MEGIIYAWQLRTKMAARDKEARSYLRAVREARKERDSDRESELAQEAMMYDDQHSMEIGYFQSRYLLNKARRLFVPVPDPKDPKTWEDGDSSFGILSVQALADLRARVWSEQERVRATALSWVSALTGLGGVIVAIIALGVRG